MSMPTATDVLPASRADADHPFLVRETHLNALARALRVLDLARLADPISRALAYADAGILAWTHSDDAEAARRSHRYWRHTTPRLRGAAA